MQFLMQGCFFQRYGLLDVRQFSEVEGGAQAVIENCLYKFMFSGVIFPNLAQPDKLIGEMSDYFGESSLVVADVTKEEVYFAKKYNDREGIIEYRFKRKDNFWEGFYITAKGEKGEARCVITEVPDYFFMPHSDQKQ